MTSQDLVQARLRLGLNIKQMAEALNTPYRTYQNWELGERRIPGIVTAVINLMEEKMGTVKLYKVECTKGFYADETGNGYSLTPWGENTEVYEGGDDGGADYLLPFDFEVAESNSGSPEIYDEKGSHCTLSKNETGCPMLICSAGREIWLKKSKAAQS